MTDNNEESIHLIQCGDHGYAPWSIVCVHLMEGESKEWLPIDSDNPEVDYDWCCPDCTPLQNEELNEEHLDKLRAVCINCVRKLRIEFDSNFEEIEI